MLVVLPGACASDAARQLGLSRLATGEAEQALLTGIGHYEDGQYDLAREQLQKAIELGLYFRSDAIRAHKHLAFILCASGETRPCANAFREVLKLDPRFELSKAEAGHPLWGPVFVAVKHQITSGRDAND